MVYVISKSGKPLMPTEKHGKVRSKNFNDENLRQYRGHKISKGRRSIRTKRYFYQPNDLVKYDGKIYIVRGVQNKGEYIALREIKKVPRVDLVKPYEFKKGFVVI